jgi:hypothetical protein
VELGCEEKLMPIASSTSDEAVFGAARGRVKKSIIHAPQHFLYFLPLPHGQGSFLPVLGCVFLICENPAVGSNFRLEFAESRAVLFARLGGSS